MKDPAIEKDLIELLDFLMSLSVGVFGLILTLFALLPAFIEIARSRSTGFLSSERHVSILRTALLLLYIALYTFGTCIIMWLVSRFVAFELLWWLSISVFGAGCILLIISAICIAVTMRKLV